MKKIIFLFLLSLPVFSQECAELQNNLKYLSSDSMLGRVPGTQEHAEARIFILKKLSALGAVVFEHEFQGGVNLWGVLYPQNNRSGVPDVMITSHYDHLDNCWQKNGHLSSVCNGAADNAAGVTILLNVLEKLKKQIKKPVAFSVFDREEDGLLGSNYFARSNLLPSITLVLNLDIVGLNTFRGMENVHLTMGGETGGEKLVKDLKSASQKSGLDTFEFSYALAHGRGDLTNFILKGIPSIHFTDGDGSVYHSSADEFQYINQNKLLKISNLIFSLTLIAEKNGPYKFINPFQGENALPSFNDIKSGKNLVNKIKKTIDTPEISRFLKDLDKIIKKGERKFSYPEMSAFQKVAFSLMEFSRDMEEIPQGSRCQD